MADRCDLVVNNIWIGPVAIDAVSENRLIVEMEGQVGFIVSSRPLENARLNLKRLIAAIAILIDSAADRVARKGSAQSAWASGARR